MSKTYNWLVDKAIEVAEHARGQAQPERGQALARVAQVYADLARIASDRELRGQGQ